MMKKVYVQPTAEVVATEVTTALLGGSLLNEAETETTGVYEDGLIGTVIGMSREFNN